MGKKRVYELAKELNVGSKDVISQAEVLGIELKNHMSTVDDAQVAQLTKQLNNKSSVPVKAAPKTQPKKSVAKPDEKKETVKSAEKPVAKSEAKSATKPVATNKEQVAKADESDSGKTKIKITAIRRDHTNPNEGQKSTSNHNNGHQTQNSRPQSHPQNNRPQNSNNGQSHPQNGVSRPQGQPNQNRNNNNNRPNSAQRPTGNQNRGNQQNGNRQNRFNQNTTNRPTGGNAGLRHLQQYKDQAAQTQETIKQQRDDERRHNERRQQEQRNRRQQQATTTNNEHKSVAKPQTKPVVKPATARINKPVTTPSVAPNKETTETQKPAKVFTHQPTSNKKGSFQKRDDFKSRPRKNKRKQRAQQRHQVTKVMPQRKERPLPETLIYSEGMNAQDLGKLLHREPAEIVKKLFMLGVMVNQNQSLDNDTIELIATDYGINAQQKVEEDISDIDKMFEEEVENKDHLASRPPVVTIMGHVDHGKTTLLDHLRHTHVTAGEAGGITQHIGAYQVKLNDRLITFLDTPGHAAFTNMRARGADITDIVILVVAADDGVMPQTIEAINHAKAANDPIIVAVNKIDKPGANPNHVMEQLTEYELIPESWGGDTIFVEISAKMGTNIDELLEMILLEADILELKANPEQKGIGTVLEARLDKGKGPVASLLVQQGTLRVGDPIVVGNTFGRVRVMTNDRGRRVKEALPSEPVEITGLSGVPDAADRFVVFDDEKSARSAGEERSKRAQLVERNKAHHVTLDNLFETMKEGELKEVDVIIKADVQGSAEALAVSLQKIEVEGVRVNIIHQAVGAINESDVTLASASDAIIIGFNVRPTPQAKSQAEGESVDIRLHNVIYRAIDEIELAMKGMLEPEYEEKITGDLTVRETYKVTKLGTIAGCFVNNGLIERDSGVRVIRNGIVIYEGKLASLKRFKDDAKEVRQGFECGVMIENFNDIKQDDEIEAFVMREVPAK